MKTSPLPHTVPAVATALPVAPPTPTPPAPSSPAAASVGRPPATAPQLPPLHLRTPEQLKDGMVVTVKGAGSADLAVARLIQDGAQFMARTAGTTMGLATVEINYREADRQGALGLATFVGNKGWFALSEASTKGLMEGIARLRSRPFDAWSEDERQSFVQANETILHEAAHVTLPAYDSANVNAWRRASRSFEEGLSEVATMTKIGDFMREEFGVQLAPLTDRISQSTSAYTRYSERIERMLGMGTDGSPAQIRQAASHVGDNVPADRRLQAIAQLVGSNLGGTDAPQELVTEIAKTLEGFVEERNGTRSKLMRLQAALVDHRAGKPVDVQQVLAQARALDAVAGRPLGPPERNGDRPIA